MRAQSAPAAAAQPGAAGDGSVLLPNGWRLAPAGKTLAVGTLPLNLVLSPDGKYLVVTNNGLGRPSLTVVDVATWTVKNTVPVDNAWLGLAWSPDGTRLYASAAAQNLVQEYMHADGTLTKARTFALPAQSGDTFVGGLAVSRDGRMLYATRVFAMTVSQIDLASGQVVKTVPLDSEPYGAVVSPDGRLLFVSLWGGAQIDVFTTDSMTLIDQLGAGDHPNAMAITDDGKRLFVACGGSSAVWVYDVNNLVPLEQVSTTLYPAAPPTATPNSVALSPDNKQLLVADADNNAVAVVDIGNSVRSNVLGFIPTAWYPTGAIFSRDGKQVFVLSGKGMTPAADPATGGMDRRLAGVVAALPAPDQTTLNDYTRRVISYMPYTDAARLAPPGAPIGSPVPRTVGGPSAIKHVFYIIRENRTYDQILGDLPQGNGAPNLTLFGADVTPNAHAIAQTFTLFDNFYVDADVSYDGHSFSTAAYANEFVEKMWQTYIANRGGPYLGEGGGFMRSPYGNIAAPPLGYLWDDARRANVAVRSYGEYVTHASRSPSGDVVAVPSVPGLSGAVAPAFAGWDLDITDQKRVDNWLKEFNDFVASGALPPLSIIRLPNDHTAGTKVGSPTPRAMVADNDLALGRVVEAVSSSVYWKDSAIFVVEDDAQSGPDHVDSHRSVLLVASPFAQHGAVDHSFYTTSGVLRTIELILGLEPMSEYDGGATPLYGGFTGTPNLAAYRSAVPRVPLDEKNVSSSFGSAASAAMDFSVEDRAPEALLNEIVWRSVKGAWSPMPPPRRSIFVRAPSAASVDDDDRN